MFAVVKTGGKQYKVKEGDTLAVEKLEAEKGASLDFNEVLMVANEAGTDIKVGDPFLAGAKVTATVIEEGRHKKIDVIKYKPKVRYHKKQGHRQMFTKVKIEKITV